MLDPVTGYDDTPICECKSCKKCDGEGSGTNYCGYNTKQLGYQDCPQCLGHRWSCDGCNGTGMDTSNCQIHGRVMA